jgi:hypothetical protein
MGFNSAFKGLRHRRLTHFLLKLNIWKCLLSPTEKFTSLKGRQWSYCISYTFIPVFRPKLSFTYIQGVLNCLAIRNVLPMEVFCSAFPSWNRTRSQDWPTSVSLKLRWKQWNKWKVLFWMALDVYCYLKCLKIYVIGWHWVQGCVFENWPFLTCLSTKHILM